MRWDRIFRAIANPRTEYAVQKAKRDHRKQHPECAVCEITGALLVRRANDVHHLVPVHVDPERATDPTNLATLCRTHHFWIGHMGNWSDYNAFCQSTINAVRDAYDDTACLVKA